MWLPRWISSKVGFDTKPCSCCRVKIRRITVRNLLESVTVINWGSTLRSRTKMLKSGVLVSAILLLLLSFGFAGASAQPGTVHDHPAHQHALAWSWTALLTACDQGETGAEHERSCGSHLCSVITTIPLAVTVEQASPRCDTQIARLTDFIPSQPAKPPRIF